MRRFLAAVATILAVGGVAAASWAESEADRFSLRDAYREDNSPQRLRISLNGLWRFQAAQALANAPPTGGWAALRVPGRWDGADVAFGGFTVRDESGKAMPGWRGTPWSLVNTAWYQRDFIVPAECSGRRVTLRFEHIGLGVDAKNIDYADAPSVNESLRQGAVVWINGSRAEALDDWLTDITSLVSRGATHTLSVAVSSNGRPTRWGKGLNGDVWLECDPITRIADATWSTSFADRSLALTVTAYNGTEAPKELRVRALLDGKVIAETPETPVASKSNATFALQAAVPSLASWSEFAPSLTPLRLELRDGAAVIDTLSFPIATRDLRITGNELVLNGRPILLRTESGPDIGYGMEVFDRGFMRNYLGAYRSANYNAIRATWGIVPDYVYDLTDQLGLMVQYVLPSPAMFRARRHLRNDAQFWTDYEAELAAQIARVRRHVSVVAYDLWAHEVIDSQQNQPDNIDGVWASHVIPGRDAVRAELLRAASVLNRLDPSREVLFDEAGNLGKAVDVHPYFDFSIPLQEWEDWPEHRSSNAPKPLIASEFGLPYVSAWNEWDTNTGDAYGGATFVIENSARYLGDDAYLRSQSAMVEADWKARGEAYVSETAIDPGRTSRRGAVTSYHPNEAGEEVAARFVAGVYRAWRAARINLGPYDQGTLTGASMLFEPRDAALAAGDAPLKTPGPKPDRIVQGASYLDTALAVAPAAWNGYQGPPFEGTKVYDATKAAFRPLLLYIGGGSDAGITNKDHAYVAGETLKKSLVIVNDGPADAHITARWQLMRAAGGFGGQQGDIDLAAPQGKTTLVPIELKAPDVPDRNDYYLQVHATNNGVAVADDRFDLQIFPAQLAPLSLPDRWRIGLYDKVGITAHVLDAMGVRYQRLERPSGDVDLLVIGAFSLDPSIAEVQPFLAKGLNILEFEQRVGTMSDLAAYTGANFDTTHMAATATRSVFPSDPASPILRGLKAADLANWRGVSDALPAFTPASGTTYLYGPGGEAKIKSSNRGIVASYVLPKPQSGNFRVILASGFDLRQTPLVEYRVGRGRLLAVQLDVSRRYGSDPVATRLMRNALAYMTTPVSAWAHAAYLGDGSGKVAFAAWGANDRDLGTRLPASLDEVDTLLVGAGGEDALRAGRDAVLAWVERGGKLLLCDDVAAALGASWFPAPVALVPSQLRLGRLPAGEELLRGLNQSDAYFRDGLPLTRFDRPGVADGPSPLGILHVGRGTIATLPITSTVRPPSATKPLGDKLARLIATVLTNAGVRLDTPFRLYPDMIELAGVWRFKTDPLDRGGVAAGWQQPDFDDADWRAINVPGFWGFQGVTERPSAGGFAYDGIAWYRRKVTIPADWKDDKQPLMLVMGGISDTGEIYWNGKLVARGEARSYFKEKMVIPIDDALIPYGGEATLAIKVTDKGPAGGLAGVTRIEKDTSWLTPRAELRYGEKFANFDPDAYRSW